MELKPLRGRVVVRPDVAPEATPGGIVLLKDPVAERAERGCVVSVGADITEIWPGQFVHFGKFAGESGKVEGGEALLVLQLDAIFAVED